MEGKLASLYARLGGYDASSIWMPGLPSAKNNAFTKNRRGDPPGNHRPGQWFEQSRRPSWGLDEVAETIYANLAHGSFIIKDG